MPGLEPEPMPGLEPQTMPGSDPRVRVGLGSGLNRGSAGGSVAGLTLGTGRSGWRGVESLGRALPLLAASGEV